MWKCLASGGDVGGGESWVRGEVVMGGMGVMGWEGRRRVLGRVDHGLVGNHSMREGGPESGRGVGLCGIVFGRHCTMELFFYEIAQLGIGWFCTEPFQGIVMLRNCEIEYGWVV